MFDSNLNVNIIKGYSVTTQVIHILQTINNIIIINSLCGTLYLYHCIIIIIIIIQLNKVQTA